MVHMSGDHFGKYTIYWSILLKSRSSISNDSGPLEIAAILMCWNTASPLILWEQQWHQQFPGVPWVGCYHTQLELWLDMGLRNITLYQQIALKCDTPVEHVPKVAKQMYKFVSEALNFLLQWAISDPYMPKGLLTPLPHPKFQIIAQTQEWALQTLKAQDIVVSYSFNVQTPSE